MQKEIILAATTGILGIVNSLVQYGDEVLRKAISGGLGVAFLILIGIVISKVIKLDLNPRSLEYHSVFSIINQYAHKIATQFKMNDNDDPVRLDIMKDIMAHVLIAYNNRLKEFISNVKQYKTHGDVMTGAMRVMNYFLQDIQTYYTKTDINNNMHVYSVEDQKTLSIMVSKFLEWHTIKMDSVRRAIESMTGNDRDFFSDMKHLVSTILSYFATLLAETLRHAQNAMAEINGDFNGCTFRGRKIVSKHAREQLLKDKDLSKGVPIKFSITRNDENFG